MTLASARTNVLLGAVHLLLFLVYLMLIFQKYEIQSTPEGIRVRDASHSQYGTELSTIRAKLATTAFTAQGTGWHSWQAFWIKNCIDRDFLRAYQMPS